MFQAINRVWIQKTGVGGNHKFQTSSKWYWSELPVIHRMWGTKWDRQTRREDVLSLVMSVLGLRKEDLYPHSHFLDSRRASFSRDRCHHWQVLSASTPPSGGSFCVLQEAGCCEEAACGKWQKYVPTCDRWLTTERTSLSLSFTQADSWRSCPISFYWKYWKPILVSEFKNTFIGRLSRPFLEFKEKL